MPSKKILCIDDSINLLQVLKKRFEFDIDDCYVLICDNGEKGISLARSEGPDLIVLDIMMPLMDGDEVLDRLKNPKNLAENEFDTRNIPILILTAHGPEERDKYLLKGASDYVSSPFDTAELVAKVKSLINANANA